MLQSLIGCLAILGFGALPSSALAQERKASVTASLTLVDMDGKPVASPDSGKPIRLRVDLKDAVTGDAPRGLELSGWIRPVDRFSRSCEEDAQSFRVTRNVSANAVDLNGALFAVLNEDASFGIIEPKLDGQPANMLGAAALVRVPDSFEIDRAGMQALMTFSGDGVVEGVSLANGSRRVLAQGLDRPSMSLATPQGVVWTAEDGAGRVTPLATDRRSLDSITVGSGGLMLSAPQPDASLIGAVARDGSYVLFDGATGATLASGTVGPDVEAATFVGETLMITLQKGSPSATFTYLDDPDHPVMVGLGFVATSIAVSPDGLQAIAFGAGLRTVAVVDIASARVVQPFSLDNATVAEVDFTDRAAFIATREGRYVAVLDLKSSAIGKAPVIRPVPLSGKGGESQGKRRLLASMSPLPQMLVADRDNQTAWIIPEVAAVGSIPPAHSIRLRGGVPLQIRVIDRSLREVAPGRFETVTKLNHGGPHELVLTSGVGGLTACLPFEAKGAVPNTNRQLFDISLVGAGKSLQAARDETLVFEVRDERGHALTVDELRVLVPSLTTSWSTEVVARRGADGQLRAIIRFPQPGQYIIQPIGQPREWQPRSTLLVEVPS